MSCPRSAVSTESVAICLRAWGRPWLAARKDAAVALLSLSTRNSPSAIRRAFGQTWGAGPLRANIGRSKRASRHHSVGFCRQHRIIRQLRRPHHVINSDNVFGSHTWLEGAPRSGSRPHRPVVRSKTTCQGQWRQAKSPSRDRTASAPAGSRR
jgi:hypothetical protein